MRWSYYGAQEASEETLDELVTYPPQVVAVDVETISDKDKTPRGLSIATSPLEAFYFPIDSPDIPWHILTDPDITKVYHNALFDLESLYPYIGQEGAENVDDTSLMAGLLNLPKKLTDLAVYAGMYARDMKQVMGRGHKTTEHLSQETIGLKCCEDTTATIAVYEELADKLDAEYYAMEVGLLPILLRMTVRGIAIDQAVRQRFQDELEEQVDYYRTLADGIGFNPASPQQVAYILGKRGNFLPTRRGRPTTNKAALHKVDDPVAGLVLNFRAAQKALSTYVKPLEGQDRAYSHYHLNAVTGRISSSDINMQNIPHNLRTMYLPDNGVFTDFDFSQIELRILAHLSQDPTMLWIFERGGDIHQATADEMGIHRYPAKQTNFAILYGATAATVVETAGVSRERAKWLLSRWFETYPTAGKWVAEVQRHGLANSYIETMGGRRIELPTTGDENEAAIRRKAVSYIIQGSAAEVLKKAMHKCSHLDIALQVYDQLVIDGRVELPDGLEYLSPVYTPYDVKDTLRWE